MSDGEFRNPHARELAAWAESVLHEPVARPVEAGEPAPVTDVTHVTVPRTPTLDGLADYLAAVRAFLTTYVAFPSEHEPVAVALWAAHAHLVERFETSPVLAITSAEMRSGKTRLLDCLELLVPFPFRCVMPSEAVTYSMLAQRPRPSLLFDEADALFGPRTAERYEGLRAVLNSGNRQGTPVPRVKLDGRRREVEAFDVYGPKAIAAIGDLPSTVTDRSIVIRLRRRAPHEPVERFRSRPARAEARGIAFDWSRLHVEPIAEVPDELNDRAADSWEPLLAIADAAGGSWPAMARAAAVAISGEDETPVSVGMRLLGDVRDAFGDADHLPTAELLRRLHELEDAPWGEWYGSPLTGRGLAKLLGPYRILPMNRRIAGETRRRGYWRANFEDAWQRYCPLPSRESVPSVPSVPRTQESRPGPVPGTDTSVPDPFQGSSAEADSVLSGAGGTDGTDGTLPREQTKTASIPGTEGGGGRPPAVPDLDDGALLTGDPPWPVEAPDVPDVPDVPDPREQTKTTVWDWDAPTCDECGRRKRAVPGRPGRYVCTGHHARQTAVGVADRGIGG